MEQRKTMNPAYVADEVIDGMINGNKDMAVVYSGDAATILAENEEMNFFLPNEGTNLWSDAMVIPANAENPKLAQDVYKRQMETNYVKLIGKQRKQLQFEQIIFTWI